MAKNSKRFELTLDTVDELKGKPIGELIEVIETGKERTENVKGKGVTTA